MTQKNKNKQNKISDALDDIKVGTSQDELVDRYKDLRGQYPDLVGRLIIHNDGATGNILNKLVVMHTPSDPEKYLYRDAEGGKSSAGTPFLDAECNIESTTDNYIIYAHNMKNLTQFGCLRYYKQESYWKKYPTINFETMYDEPYDYEIFAVFYSQVYTVGYEGFKYYNFKDAANEEEFNDFIKNVKEMALYDTGITPQYGEQLLTLSTCDYSRVKEVGRFVVCARKKEGRTPANNAFANTSQSVDTEVTPAPEQTPEPTVTPTARPTVAPTVAPTPAPTVEPTLDPTVEPTPDPTVEPTPDPTVEPTYDLMTYSPWYRNG